MKKEKTKKPPKFNKYKKKKTAKSGKDLAPDNNRNGPKYFLQAMQYQGFKFERRGDQLIVTPPKITYINERNEKVTEPVMSDSIRLAIMERKAYIMETLQDEH